MRVPAKGKITGSNPMQVVMIAFLALACLFVPMNVHAESSDVEATIKTVDPDSLSLKLDDGKTYQAPEEFNFEGLTEGVKVIVYYTVVDGKRVIDDLQIVQ